jgi:sterol desaturase/sphingolipid hydroxylase (fatty acid hydroxylase superfamily)
MIEIIEYITLALIPGFILLDLVYHARKYNRARFWRLRALVVTVGIFFLTGSVATFWGTLLDGYTLLEGSRLGTAWGTVAGILVYEFFHYWYHRKAHEWNWLWRTSHQMHHSAESLDAFGANYLHPVDAAIFTTIASLVFFPLLGLTIEAGVIAALFLTFNAMFQHANLKTPHWLGYIIQRPESHHVHHGKGIHRNNYSDLPLWDMLFGTFHNPRAAELVNLECGFYKGASARIPEMLIGRLVDKPKSVMTDNEVYGQFTAKDAA